MKGLIGTAPTWFILKTEAPIHTAWENPNSFKLTETKNGTKGRKGQREGEEVAVGRRRTNDIPSQNSLNFNKNRKQNGGLEGQAGY